MRRYIYISLVLLLIPLSALALQDKNPFVPYATGSQSSFDSDDSKQSIDPTASPLVKYPVTSYKIVGVIVSPKEKFAVIQTPEGRDYFVTTEELLGNEGGKVSGINVDGISVNVGDGSTNLPVSNKYEQQPIVNSGSEKTS